MRTFVIDTDTASDDAVALILALRAKDVRVAAITTVAGNVPVAQATRNALYTAELCGSDVPVFGGADRPLWRKHMHAEWFHGKDGLGDHGYAPARRVPEAAHAVDAILNTIEENPGLTLVTLGPLTTQESGNSSGRSLAAVAYSNTATSSYLCICRSFVSCRGTCLASSPRHRLTRNAAPDDARNCLK